MPQISVIVPVYKVEAYLPKCIDSILHQSFTDFELILVDDGSPDNCGAICDEYAEKDSRIRVIHQDNQGVSAARNLGISDAQGKYIAFVDSDDYIHPQMFEVLCYVMEHTDYPFIHCAFHRLRTGEEEPMPQKYVCSLNLLQELSSEQGMLKMMDWKTYGHYIIKGLYRTSYIREIPFPLGVRWEDVVWSGEVVGRAEKYGYVPYDLYTYVIHETSLVRTYAWSTQRDYFPAFQKYMNLARQLTPGVADDVELAVYQAFLERENTLHKNGMLDADAKKAIASAAKSCNLTVSKVLHSNLDVRRKGIYLLCLISFPLGCRVRRALIQ